MRNNKPIIIGTGGATVLFTIYFGILTLVNSFTYALEQFLDLWFWISLLAIGFGFQLGLYFYIRFGVRKKLAGATVEIAVSKHSRMEVINHDREGYGPGLSHGDRQRHCCRTG